MFSQQPNLDAPPAMSYSLHPTARFTRNRFSSDMDRFCVLPDEVLVHILSFLDTKECVSTSILAKRWRFLWARVCHLSFASDDFRPETRARFSRIINRVLLLHRGYNIDYFDLLYKEYDGISNYELKTWVRALIACNVRELILLLACDVKLPRYLFTCKTLVRLDLTCCGDIPAATFTVHLPALKILTLHGVYYKTDESLPHLLSGCPVLEEVDISSGFMLRCCISSPTIKKLVVRIDDDHDIRNPGYFSIGTLASLAEAEIEIFFTMELIGGGIPYFHHVVKLVGKVCDVKRLRLSTCLMKEVPDSAFSALTIKFSNLIELHLAADWRFVTKFLQSADNLQDLTINTGRDECPENWVEPDEVAACLVSRVGIVRFDDFGCTNEQEFKMVRYILRNAKVLKRMTIRLNCFGLDSKKKELEAVQKIRSFEKGSEACEISFD